jgi:1-aminocyclopropane-1-carboxylate deaminase/D-cysteine desulfhydrase-like pyridoxal-dependent ACC family enzyme
MTDLTRVDHFGTWYAKRDDTAFATSVDAPSGSKVRQYARMAAAQGRAPMIVGCSAHSAMQIYIAAGAKLAGVKGIVYTAARAVRTDATEYALRMGAEVVEVRPAYLNVVQSRAHQRAKEFAEGYVRWDVDGAVRDASEQVSNIPHGIKRIVVPTGSGLTASGILAGLVLSGLPPVPVLCVAVSPMADKAKIQEDARKCIDGLKMGSAIGSKHKLPSLKVVRAKQKYDQWTAAILPDGTVLDPFYSAKALPYLKDGDLLWLPGVRPLCAMPVKCQKQIAEQRVRLDGGNAWTFKGIV